MGPEIPDDALRHLKVENLRLKHRVFELEEKLRHAGQPVETKEKSTSVLKLIEHKDFMLEQHAARLQEKKEQLEEAEKALEAATAQVALWMASLRLYQEIFENDASALLGVSKDARILLFNRTAPQLLGEKFKDSLHKSIDTVDFRAFDPETPAKVRRALSGRKPVESSLVVRDRRILTSILPIGTDADPRGAIIRIQVLGAK